MASFVEMKNWATLHFELLAILILICPHTHSNEET